MSKYLLFIFCIILLLKLYYNNINTEYMTQAEQITRMIGLGYDEENAKSIVGNVDNICALKPDTPQLIGIGNITPEYKRELTFKNYKLKIKSGEQFQQKLDIIEQDVFKMFFGSSWQNEYDEWLKRRDMEIAKRLENKCKDMAVYDENISKEDLYNKLNTLSYLEKINRDAQTAAYGSKSNNSADLSIRKIQYRSKEESKLEYYNMIINWIYYLLFIILILLLYTNNNLHIKTRFVYYIALFLLPNVIYPYSFKIVQYIYKNINDEEPLPKNAFMNG